MPQQQFMEMFSKYYTMRKLLIILLSVLSLPTVAQQQKVAVYVTGDEVEAKVLGSRLQTDITQSGKYTVIERNATFLAELKKEQSYQRTGAVDDEELSRLGKQFGVSLICVADIFPAFGESYVSARLINVVSAEVIHTASANGNLQDYQNMRNISATIVGDLLTQVEEKADRKKVAVYIAQSQSKEIGRVLGDKLVAGFTRSGQYTAVERTNSFLSQLNKEQKYQRTGEVDDNDISRLGKQFGVQYVCVAEVSDYYGDQKYIAARLVDVETAELVDAYDGGGSINSMSSCVRMANEIAGKLSHTELSYIPAPYTPLRSTTLPNNGSKFGNCNLTEIYSAYIQKRYSGRDISEDESAKNYMQEQVKKAVESVTREYGLVGIFDDAAILYKGRDAKDITGLVMRKLNLQ